jgi:hypothetical protein
MKLDQMERITTLRFIHTQVQIKHLQFLATSLEQRKFLLKFGEQVVVERTSTTALTMVVEQVATQRQLFQLRLQEKF